MTRKIITKEWLIEQNVTLGKTINQISKEFNITQSRLYRGFRFFDLKFLHHEDKIKLQRKATCLEKYGSAAYTQTEEFKTKTKKTNLERYGKENYAQTEEHKRKVKETNIEKYGVDNYTKSEEFKEKMTDVLAKRTKEQTNISNEKRNNTCLERYGTTVPLRNENVREKSKQTCLEKYGVESYVQLKECHDKMKDTSLDRYGTEYFSQSDNGKEILKRTILEKYGVENFNQIHMSKASLEKLKSKEWLYDNHIVNKRTHSDIARELSVSPSSVDKACAKLNIPTQHFMTSDEEKELLTFIHSIYTGDIIENSRSIIPPQELDIYIPERKLAIEYNGIFWHSFDCVETPEEKNYHLNKTIKCEANGIQLLHIYSSEWINKQNIIKSIISAKLGVYQQKIGARECEVREVSSEVSRNFLNKNHLQDYCGASIRLGLLHNDELLSIMTFCKPRYNKKYDWELVRFANKLNTLVIGGASKLLHTFTKTHTNESIISYADRRYSNGGLYLKLGLSKIGCSKPSYFYTNDNLTLHSRVKFQKHKLSNMLANFDEALTEHENMYANKYRRIWDCGTLAYSLN